MRITDKQKDNMLTTNHFIWLLPLFVFIAFLCKDDLPMEHKTYSHNHYSASTVALLLEYLD